MILPAMICPMILAWRSWGPIPIVSLIHSSIGAPSAFNGLITLLHSVFAFSNAKVCINTCVTSESEMALFTAETNLCKTSVKASLEPCTISVNKVHFFLNSTLSQALKAAKGHYSIVASSNWICSCISEYWPWYSTGLLLYALPLLYFTVQYSRLLPPPL